jgi:hypothetical protein
MKNKLIKVLIHLTIILSLILLYALIVEVNSSFRLLLILVTLVGTLFCLIYLKTTLSILKKTPTDRYISIISLEIALIVFIQTSIQVRENNKQFEQNRIASESLFQTQLKHSEKLNQLQIQSAKELNDSVIGELNEIQEINLNQSLASKNQLIATQKQLELSKQSLDDYIYETKSNIILETIDIVNRDTIEGNKVKLSISTRIQNIGKREAEKVEFRQITILDNRETTDLTINSDATFLSINAPKNISYHTTIPIKDSENFFYWLQIRYYDKKLDEYFDRSYYRHYYKTPKGFDFYYARNEEKEKLREIIDKELKLKGYSLTEN